MRQQGLRRFPVSGGSPRERLAEPLSSVTWEVTLETLRWARKCIHGCWGWGLRLGRGLEQELLQRKLMRSLCC